MTQVPLEWRACGPLRRADSQSLMAGAPPSDLNDPEMHEGLPYCNPAAGRAPYPTAATTPFIQWSEGTGCRYNPVTKPRQGRSGQAKRARDLRTGTAENSAALSIATMRPHQRWSKCHMDGLTCLPQYQHVPFTRKASAAVSVNLVIMSWPGWEAHFHTERASSD